MPEARPEADACAQCHDELPDSHLTHHPEANMIATDYFTSGHSGADGRNEAICVKCHNDEGARKYKDVTTWEGLAATLPIEGTTHAIQCRTCHDPHHAGELLIPEQDSGYPDHILVKSSEYATCTNCHQDSDAQLVSLEGKTYAQWEAEMLALAGSDDRAEGDLIYHAARFERVISSTHFDNPLTSYQSNEAGTAPSRIEGYVVRAADDHACRDCHNVHSTNNEINQQWARSGHGGRILEAKEAVDADGHSITGAVDVRLAGADDNYAAAWNHYDWDAGDRQDCQMCHTTTGAMNYLSDPATYNPANNDFSHLDGWQVDEGVVTSSGQNEVLYCWGCHSNNSGDLRNPGAVTLAYYTVDGENPVLPDVGESNLCINCHSGRGNMDSYVENSVANPATDMSELRPGFGGNTINVTSAHYLTAAATIFQEETRIGYEYPGQDYTDASYFEHNIIAADSEGPCVACHMETDEPHAWEIVSKDETGAITALNSSACVECHDGSHGAALVAQDSDAGTAAAAAAFLEAEAEGYHEALEILNQALISRGLTFSAGYPYFSGASWINEGLFGAAHNYNYLHHELGAYAHNRFYTKRLIFDSIDWADNFALDGEISVDAATYPEAAHWLGVEEGVATRP
jgi:5-methylcytosine-specific restriction endonuclease McrA